MEFLKKQPSILRLKDVSKAFDGVRALDKVSFNIAVSSITAIVGPNGSGKTTLFNVLSGFLMPDKGRIIFNDIDITKLASSKIPQLGIARTFQLIRIFPNLKVIENILLALERPYREGLIFGFNPFIRYSPRNIIAKALEILEIGDLVSKKDEYASHLSHGQRRILEILRTIALGGKLFLFDEPTAGVFPGLRERIIKILYNLKERGNTICFIEHNMDVVSEIA